MKSAYKIFVSFSKFDILIGTIIASSFNNYFKGDVEVFFAPKSIRIGAKWKEDILNALRESDALILLISPDTYDKPWLIAEFSAFWLLDKDIYILKYGDIDFNKVFNIFTDYQICDIQDKSDIRGLIEVVSTKASVAFAPFDKVDDFYQELEKAIDETLNNRLLSVSLQSKSFEVKQKEIVEIAQSIPRDARQRSVSKEKIANLARDIGLFQNWTINPQLTYENGDIAWYSQQNYTWLKIEADFRAKFFVLSLAEKEGIVISTQGDLSNAAKGLSGEIQREWHNQTT